jgi:hypothetical protein
MGIDPEKLATSFGWIDMDLEEIMMRHEFIKKTGCFKTPDPKRPQIEMVSFYSSCFKQFVSEKSSSASNF